ncbi:zinc finger-containing ubiquitin peptidase 1-like isoform X2 [Tachypleus tridentatus]|uniref:zinc finger-containing ubiquitin peptidase 1-like isoform X2 n=1 Tax=Tachypleus tridentatus TaxID=6853 RepID=UPI003FD6031E
MASNNQELFCCDICGEGRMTIVDLKSHMVVAHIEGAISCPFCDLGDITVDEMYDHVNSVHLDLQNPEGENLASPQNDSQPQIKIDNYAFTNSYASESPERTKLKLNLNYAAANASVLSPQSCESSGLITCPLCNFKDSSPNKVQEHVNRRHFDLTSPSFPDFLSPDSAGNLVFKCPVCSRNFETGSDLELHVNLDHPDILSPIKSSEVTPSDENSNECCPMCSRSDFANGMELASHIKEHFDQKVQSSMTVSPQTPSKWPSVSNSEDGALSDHLLALEIERREREEQRLREQREFRMLQAQYGMDNLGNYHEQSITNMQQAVYAGEMSVLDYYNRQAELKMAEQNGIDDGHSCTKGLIQKIQTFSAASVQVQQTWLCTTVDHYGCSYGDRGWGCGYRNLQMLLSNLMHHTGYNYRLFRGKTTIPSISKLQELIEGAWRKGFDIQGCEQLGGRLTKTRKWIGATEIVTFFSSFHIRCQLIDFHQPTGPNGTHSEMFIWVKNYFSKEEDFKVPLYLQHHGHSRTVIGVEEHTDGSLQLLVFDSSHCKAQMDQFNNTANLSNAMRLIRRPLSALKARQYQLVAVAGLMETEQEYEILFNMIADRH